MRTLKGMVMGLAAVAILFTSCDKDAAAEKKLSGTWTVTSMTVNGTENISDSTTMSMEFSECAKDAATCTAYMNVTWAGTTMIDTIDYSVEGDGMYFVSHGTETDAAGVETATMDTMDITTLTSTEATLTGTSQEVSVDPTTFEITYTEVPMVITMTKN